MVDQDVFETLLPRAYQWAREQEEFILERGIPLPERAVADATRVGVKSPDRVRVLIVEKIPMPTDPHLAEASRRANIITDTSRAIAIGYGVVIRADRWGDRELLLHQLVHVAQAERYDDLETYVRHYLSDRHTCPEFTFGSLEDEARSLAREICAAGS